MRTCERCGRAFAEVIGAPEQTCPYCGHAHREAVQAFAAPEPVDPVSATKAAGRFFAKHWGALALLWLPVVLVDVATQIALTAYDNAHGITPDLTQMALADRLRFLGVALPTLVVAFAVELGMWSVISAFVLERSGVAPAGALRRLARAPWSALALGLLMTLSFFVGLVLLIVPFFFFLHRYLYAPSALAEGGSVAGAFRDSSRFAKERRTFGFTALVVLVWVALVVVEYALSGPEQALLQLVGVPPSYAEAIAPPLASWPLAPFLPLLPASYWLVARQAQRSIAEAPVLTPDQSPAASAERFRTTKCPQCGTLVPYSATGGAVEVVCPVCGRAGKVLS